MKKINLLTFISKYNLSNVEQAKFTSNTLDKQLSTSFITEDKSVIGKVVFKEFNNDDSEDFEVAIGETSKLKSLLSVLEEEFTFKIKRCDDTPVSISLKDKSTVIDYVLCDPHIVATAPTLKTIPEYDIEIVCDKDFVTKFIKAKNALSDANTFALVYEDNKLNIYIGHSGNNTNRVRLDVKAVDGKNKVNRIIHFSAKYFKEIISANSETTEFKLYISSKGLAKVEFDTTEFYSEYFFKEIKIEN